MCLNICFSVFMHNSFDIILVCTYSENKWLRSIQIIFSDKQNLFLIKLFLLKLKKCFEIKQIKIKIGYEIMNY